MTTEYFDNSSSILSSTENATEYVSPQENSNAVNEPVTQDAL